MSAEDNIREIVDEAKAPGRFNIVDVLKGRGYPQTSVQIILDEALAFEASSLKKRFDEVDGKKLNEKQIAEREQLSIELEDMRERLSKSAYTVHLMGISEGRREEIYRDAVKKYPIEYETVNPLEGLLGQVKKVEKESPERDSLFTDFLWLEHIKKIVDSEGNEQTDFTYSTIRTMRESFPLSAILRVNEAIESLRTSTAVFMMETAEDFLAKP